MNQIWLGNTAIVLLAIELKIGSGTEFEESEAEEGKKVLSMHREKIKPGMDKLIEDQQKDEKLQAVLKKINECRAKHSNENKTQTPSILAQNEKPKFSIVVARRHLSDPCASATSVWQCFRTSNGQVQARSGNQSCLETMVTEHQILFRQEQPHTTGSGLLGQKQLLTKGDNSQGYRIHFTSADNSCYSRIGMVGSDGGIQPINLGPVANRMVIHDQLAHTLGFCTNILALTTKLGFTRAIPTRVMWTSLIDKRSTLSSTGRVGRTLAPLHISAQV
uniref:Metalloendopeptidase n=1 Tax=Globodera rostochiensis TaxID=31243 RepID=A0A914HJB2_GLORO